MTDTLEDIKIIDTDAHFTEPHDLWTSRVPASYKELVPHVKTVDGRQRWFVDNDVSLRGAGPDSVIVKGADAAKVPGVEFNKFTIEDVHESSYDGPARVESLDRLGLHAQVMYPNVAGFGNVRFLKIRDPELRMLCVTVYNDAMADMQKESGDRLFPMALVPWWDIDAAVKEVQRVNELGLRGIVTCNDPDQLGMPDLAQPDWDPLWDACSQLKMPVNFHIGANSEGFDAFGHCAWPSFGKEARLALASAFLYLDNARILGNLIYSGVLDRFPECKFVSVESGVGWVPFYLQALDYQLTEAAPNELKRLKLKPSEYFKRQLYACFWFEQLPPQSVLEQLGVENVLFETDYPHPTCLYPDAREHLKKTTAHFDDATRKRILQDNAAELYRIPV
ncbi:amidohydrolase family protein [Pseudohaliea sp.]|uniref:amidohydrolase family protein n=1 Tax=Pseudohaliea sp. TaxID=2740289 RepID=UPI0032EDF4FA